METFTWDIDVTNHISQYTWVWITSGILYMPLVQAIEYYSSNWKHNKRIIVKTRLVWFFWNVMLSAFSALGCFYTFSHAKQLIIGDNQTCVFTDSSNKDGVAGQWHMFFCTSKVIELGDTIFLAILSKPIQFLHWYHHILTLFSCYLLLIDFRPYTSMGMFVNFGVHAMMYMYYALSSVNIRVPNSIAKSITTIQTSQMITMAWYSIHSIYRCGYTHALFATLVMYMLYLVMFVQFFVKKYSKKHN